MSKVKIEGNGSGTGTFTIAAPAGNTDRTLTLPDEAGTVLTSAGAGTDYLTPTGDGSGLTGITTGKILQVVQAVTTAQQSTTSLSAVAVTGLTASITPSNTSSKILILTNVTCAVYPAFWIYKDGSALTGATNTHSFGGQVGGQANMTYLDSPATTSSTTYAIYFASFNGSDTVYTNRTNYNGAGNRGISTITLMEVAA